MDLYTFVTFMITKQYTWKSNNKFLDLTSQFNLTIVVALRAVFEYSAINQ